MNIGRLSVKFWNNQFTRHRDFPAFTPVEAGTQFSNPRLLNSPYLISKAEGSWKMSADQNDDRFSVFCET